MKKRIIGLVLVVGLLLSLLPTSVLAATEYPLYINEFQFTGAALTYNGEKGSATYDPNSNTLTLNNLTVSTSYSNGIIWNEIPGLTIVVNGTTNINLKDSSPNSGGDIAQQKNIALYLQENTTIKGASGNKNTDKIVITSKTTNASTDLDHNTTRVGIYTPGGAQLTVENITLSMTDTSTGSYLGSACLLYTGESTTITGSKLIAQGCGLGLYMGSDKSATVKNTEFDMKLAGDGSSALNFSAGSDNRMENCSGTVEATYPLYTYGTTTVTGSGKLTLKAVGSSGMAAVSTLYPSTSGAKYAPGKLIFDNANVEMISEYMGIQIEANSSAVIRGGTVSATANWGVNVKGSSGSFTLESGKLNLTGTGSYPVGINTYGKVTVSGGELTIKEAYAAIQNVATEPLSFTGGTHNLSATQVGYIDSQIGALNIGGTAKVTINAPIGLQLSKDMGGKLNLTGGELNVNSTDKGLYLRSGAGKTTLSGGTLNITDPNETPAATGIYAEGQTEFGGTNINFTGCKYDIQSFNANNKLTGGKLSLSANYAGMMLGGGFTMTGGEIVSSGCTFGIIPNKGTTTFSGGKVSLSASYPFYLTNGGIVDFAGANVTANATANCALFLNNDTEGNSYKITGGTVVLTSTQAGTNALYTSIPANYGVWAGANEASAKLIENPTQPILATNKYVRFAENQTYTLTLVNVKEGTSATLHPDDTITYTAKDAAEGQHFSHWGLTVNGATTTVGTDATYSGKMPNADATLTAVYESCHGGTATCTARATCEVCGKPYGDLASHSFTAENVDEKYLEAPANCDHPAVYYKSCTGCGATSEGTDSEALFEYGTVLDHNWGGWVSNGDGTHTHTCSRNPEHTETDNCHGGTADCTHKAVCDDCGSEYGDTADHNYAAETVDEKYLKSAADCDHAAVYYKSCTGCGATSKGTDGEATFENGTALGHDWGAWKSNGDGTHTHTCSRNSEHTETKDCHGGTADCTHKAVCSDCGSEYGDTADHNYAAETVDEKYLKSAADCDHAAVYYKSCTGCGATSKGTDGEATFENGTALGHDEVIDAEKAPTCTESGLTEGKHCARCNEILVAQTEVPALGHDVTDGTVTKQPTCTEYGEIVGTCSRCGETNVIAKLDTLPHTEEDVAEIPATCTESGWSAGKHCTVCGEYTEGHELLAPLGHKLQALPETDTLTEGQECSVCHAIVIPQLPKLSDYWTSDGNYDAELYASEPGNWVLYDAADLAAYAKKINDGGSFAGYTVTLANDIDLSGHIWTPIAPNYTATNVGTFDGAMYTIRGMYAESDRFAALFGNVTGSTVLNVTVYGDVRMVTSGYQTRNGNYAAGLIAYASRTVIRNCGFVGTVSMYAPETNYAREVGGLTAFHCIGVTENCYAIATIYTSGSKPAYLGGIAAELMNFINGEWTELRNCYTACQFYVDTGANIGALVGSAKGYSSFTDCYVQSSYTSGYSASLRGYGNQTYTTLPTAGMTDPDVLLAGLNRYVAQDESHLCNAWLLDPSVNGGYPFHGLSVWFTPNVEGAKTAVQAVRSGATVTAPTLDIAGYRCEGWYTDADFATEFDFTQPITANTVVYGKYLSNTYSLTYVLNGGENAAANPTEFLYGTGAALVDPTRENYLFDGWYTDADFKNKVTEIAADTAQDVTLYAKWTLDPNHPHVYGICKIGSDGLHVHACTICGEEADCEYTTQVVAPTCTSAGYTVHTCTACGNSYIDTIVEGGHHWNSTVVAPTHTEMGYTVFECSVCHESYKANYTAPIGHTFDEGTVTKPATCTDEGVMTYTCSCGETHTAPIAKTGHSWDNGKVVSAATLTETGKLIQTCSACGATKETVIPMLSSCDGGEGCPSSAYTDVPGTDNWAHVGIDFVLKSGLFYGTSDTTFEPDSAMTRAMLVTVLYRLEGQPKSAAENPFTDVETGTWYTEAVIWAAGNGIVNGIGNDKFDPDGEITREQMAAILYRYSEFKGLTPKEGKFAAEYPDEDAISAYALDAMRWANAEGLINGTELRGTAYLDPQGSATRAQVAAILMRYVRNFLTK